MRIIHIINSDFGINNTIGWRSKPIAKLCEPKIFCRNFKNDSYKLVKVVPFGKLIMQILTGINIYLSKKFPSNTIKLKIFDYFCIKKIQKENLDDVKIIHSWDFLPKTYNYIKSQNKQIKIIQDMPIALPNMLWNLRINHFNKEELKIPEYFKKIKNKVDYFLVPSEFVKESLIREKINSKNIKIIPFGVDINKFKPKKNKKFRVAFSGNVNYRKGIDELIEVWKELIDNNEIKGELNIYGRIYPEIKHLLKNNNKYNINIHGFIKIEKELPKNKIFAFPTLMEGSAKAIYEAMASGLVIITTKNAGSVITDQKEGFIIPTQNKKYLKKYILKLYNDEKLLKKMSMEARKTAKKYTWEEYGNKVNKFYNKLISDK